MADIIKFETELALISCKLLIESYSSESWNRSAGRVLLAHRLHYKETVLLRKILLLLES